MQLSHNTNQVLQDSPRSTTQLLNQTHMMSHIFCRLINPSSPLTLLVLGDVIQQPALVCPVQLPSQLSCLPFSMPSSLSSCLVPGVCYVIQPVDLFPSSVQHYSALINANLHQSITLVVASYKARKRILQKYLHVQIHSIMQWYYWYYASKDR